MRAVTLGLLLCPSLLYAQGPCPPDAPDNFGWDKDATVYVSIESPIIAEAATKAMEDWTKANADSGAGVKFELFNGSSDPNKFGIVMRYEPFTGEAVGGDFQIQVSNATNRPQYPPPGILRINENMIKPGLPDFQNALRKAINHELGHSMGLDHVPLASEVPQGTVMNRIAGMNDSGNNMALKPTGCDKDATARRRGVKTGDSGGSGGGSPTRPRPPNMPGGQDGCHPCRVHIPVPEGRARDEYGFCCGGNAINAYPRPIDLGPNLNFINMQYRCQFDGWREVACAADMCCVHPDDMPPLADQIEYGTTCYDQGWWAANGRDTCEEIAGTPPNATEAEKRCVKKIICGPGLCESWPHYCWKLPNGWHGGGSGGGSGGGGGGDGDSPPPNGKPCSQMGWYDGTSEGNAECLRDHAYCVTKSDCEGQCYPDPPGYCFKGID